MNPMGAYVQAMALGELKAAGCKTVHLNGHTIVLWYVGGEVYAVDNRCPHMGFPLDQGTVNDGILTCHWHHARFDLETGGTFDQFADDVRAFPVDIRDDQIWVDVARHDDPRQHQRERLRVGLERDISLVLGKAVLVLLEGDGSQGNPVEPFRLGLEFGTLYRRGGWSSGLTMLTCFMNLLPHLDAEDRPRALYHGLSAVARETFGHAPRFAVRPLPHSEQTDVPTLKRWFRQFIAVRDAEGAERCVVSAIRAGASATEMADMMFTAVTDFRYVDNGHPADFTNKAFEALDVAGWQFAEPALTSLVSGYAFASRKEEANAWRHPIDLVSILEERFALLPGALAEGRAAAGAWDGGAELLTVLHADNAQDIADAMLAAIRAGCRPVALASLVSHAAALRIARFHTSNEFPDWDTALHTFTFANAIEQGLRRAPSAELLRGVFDAAMSIYLDRFLNIPAARIPQPSGTAEPLSLLPTLLDRQQQVDKAAEVVAHHLYEDGSPEALLAMLGKLLLREDRDFHTIQTIEGAFRQFARSQGDEAGVHALIAAVRYLAAHAPTVRAQGQTYDIAVRLHRGERLFEG